MSVPKSKILSVSRGIIGLNEMKIGSGKTTQNVVVNVNTAKTRKAVIDNEEQNDIVIVEPTPATEPVVNVGYDNPYVTREISTEEDIKKDYEQLLKVIKTKESITQALSIMLNLVENNPLIINKYIISPKDILTNLILLLTEADKVDILLSIDDVGCSCSPSNKYAVIDKIYITKDGSTSILKYGFAETLQILENHRISTKLCLTQN
jgi:hypothetical protein